MRPARYKCAWGGRGSGKSEFFAELMIREAVQMKGYKAACIRETQKSIKYSVKSLLEEKIRKFNVEHLFEVQDQVIKCPGDGIIIFQGLQSHNADSIKSLNGFDRFWIEEGQALSTPSFRKLRPTLRAGNSEIWCSYNPETPDDAVDKFFRNIEDEDDKNFIVVNSNWSDNPWFPPELELERQIDLKRNPIDYAHIWDGAYLTRSDAMVFHNWKVDEFDTPKDAKFLFGADWGFSKDPSTLVRMFIQEQKLFIDYEAYAIGVPTMQLPTLFDKVPESRKWPIRADNARPENIDHMQRNGFPRMVRSTKGKNSVLDGVDFIRSYDVVVHKRCTFVTKEFAHYRYKVDKDTELVLPELEDTNNHTIDAIRYGLELERKAKRHRGLTSFFGPKTIY